MASWLEAWSRRRRCVGWRMVKIKSGGGAGDKRRGVSSWHGIATRKKGGGESRNKIPDLPTARYLIAKKHYSVETKTYLNTTQRNQRNRGRYKSATKHPQKTSKLSENQTKKQERRKNKTSYSLP